jgi:hypothetical protein
MIDWNEEGEQEHAIYDEDCLPFGADTCGRHVEQFGPGSET